MVNQSICKHITFCGGRLANQLYYCLAAFVLSKKNNRKIVYDLSNAYDFASDDLKKLGMANFFQETVSSDCVRYSTYFQEFGQDFLEDDLREFIENTILLSEEFSLAKRRFLENQIDNSSSVAIHIRNGDYLKNPPHDFFDRTKYLEDAISLLKKNDSRLEKVYVFSDDNDLNRKKYGAILDSNFSQVNFVDGNSAVQDLLLLSLFEHKILWNSTFSYWAGFIGDVFRKKTNENIIPSLFFRFFSFAASKAEIRCPKQWKQIKVNIVS